jgi:hypothetical protein
LDRGLESGWIGKLRLPLPSNVLPARIIAVAGGRTNAETSEPLYAGPAPLQAAGISQINFPANEKSLVLMIGTDLSSNGFLIHVTGGGRLPCYHE